MADPKDPTADYRPYPKGPNFLGIVIGASIAILVILVIAYFVVGRDGRHLIPHRRSAEPNSFVRPLLPSGAPAIA